MEDLRNEMEQMRIWETRVERGKIGIGIPNTTSSTQQPRQQVTKDGTPFCCIWCDSYDHPKRKCSDLANMISKGLVQVDEKYYVKDADGANLMPRPGRGGLKAGWEEKHRVSSTTTNATSNTLLFIQER